jgi:tetratricopeptide (TPR) repeat protein
MKPMGTIMKYYPFIDEESKSILDSLMEDASSYYDFVQRLCTHILENKVPVNLAYIAAVQAWWCRIEETMRLIQEKYKDLPFVQPWGYIHGTTVSHQARYHDAVVESIDNALASSIDDWMKVELHLLHTHFHYPYFGDVPSLLEPLEKAKSLIKDTPLLTCFEPWVLVYEGLAQGREGHLKDAVATYRKGLELAKRNDDSLYMHLNFETLSSDLKDTDIHESLALLEEMYNLDQDLEVPYLISEVLFDSSIVFEETGEYDLAVSSLNESIKILAGGDTTSLALSRIYATLGDGLRAFEYASEAFDYVGNLEFPLLYLRKAWALALLNRLDEAESNLATAHSLILKTGQTIRLSRYYHIAGVIEHARGDNLAALDLLEQSYEIASGIYEVITLLELARVEVSLEVQSMDSTMKITPGKWLSTLEKYATERDLPGIRMSAALFKSEFYQKHGQLKDAHAILMDALTISDSPGVKTLREKINERIRELNQLLRGADVSSEKRNS